MLKLCLIWQHWLLVCLQTLGGGVLKVHLFGRSWLHWIRSNFCLLATVCKEPDESPQTDSMSLMNDSFSLPYSQKSARILNAVMKFWAASSSCCTLTLNLSRSFMMFLDCRVPWFCFLQYCNTLNFSEFPLFVPSLGVWKPLLCCPCCHTWTSMKMLSADSESFEYWLHFPQNLRAQV